jgi:phosphate transport system substrate-binding protein
VIESNNYPLALSLYLYINRANSAALQPLLTFAVTESAIAPIINSGFFPVSPRNVETNRSIVSGELDGRVYSRAVDEFRVPPELAGNIEIAGTGNSFSVFKGAADSLTTNNQNLAITFKMEGAAAGVRRMCNGEVDIVITSSQLTAEQQAACTANNVTPVEFVIGTQAVVLLGHEGDTFSQCLTQAQLATIWGAPATNTVENWQAVNETFGDVPLTLFGFANAGEIGDLLLSAPNTPDLPLREDTELNSDPLYRAAAVGNVVGALTYMSWADYQRVLANNQARIQLVALDSGNGCVSPSLETIQNGTYPLAQTLRLYGTQSALTDIAAQSYLWTVFSDAQVSGLTSQSLLGFDAATLPLFRQNLQDAYKAAQTASANAAAEATAEATSEATPESTPNVGG